MSEREDVAVRFRDRNYFGWNGKSLYKGYYSHPYIAKLVCGVIRNLSLSLP